MKKTKKRTFVAVTALVATVGLITILGTRPSAATEGERLPYCSAQKLEEGPKAATEAYQVTSYEPEYCRPIPPATVVDHVCGFRGYVTIPEHNEYLIDYFIGDVEVDAGQHPQELGATAHVTAEVRYDGNDEADYHEEFVFSTPDCTPEPGQPGAPGAPGQPGSSGAPGPVVVVNPPAARPITGSPTTTG